MTTNMKHQFKVIVHRADGSFYSSELHDSLEDALMCASQTMGELKLMDGYRMAITCSMPRFTGNVEHTILAFKNINRIWHVDDSNT